MPERRPFPPSPRRLALARAAGLTAASPLLVGAAALVGAVVVLVGVGRAAAAKLGAWIAAACAGADGESISALRGSQMHEPSAGGGSTLGDGAAGGSMLGDGADAVPDAAAFARAVLELALPLLVAAALAALVLHVAQTRTLWLPRRRLPGTPVVSRRAGVRGLFDASALVIIGAVTLGWLWLTAPQLAMLAQVPSAAALAIASFVVSLAIAWVAVAALDALLRRAQLADALSMTREEKREDDRLSAADPRWQAQRLAVLRGPAVSDAIARAAVVLVGDDVAIAIEWDAARQPVPLRTASGRGARAMQLGALARRHRVPLHRDVALASALAGEGPVPDVHWARLAEVVAAVRAR